MNRGMSMVKIEKGCYGFLWLPSGHPSGHFINNIGCGQGGLPVGDNEHRFVCAQLFEGLENDTFIQRVQVAGGLVQKQERSIVKEGPGNSDPLFFSAGESVAKFAYHSVIPIRKALNEFM